MDLFILGMFKVFDRNEKAITDGLYFKRRVFEMHREFNNDEYKKWRKAIAFDSSMLIDSISSVNTCYASHPMNGSILSTEKLQLDEIQEMFYVVEPGRTGAEIKLINISTWKLYDVTRFGEESSQIKPASKSSYPIIGMVRKLRRSDNIDNLG